MFPVLLSVGNFSVSSFGLFLVLGIAFGSFIVWRISRAYDLDPEKVLDLVFLTIGSGLILSRIGFILSNLAMFDTFTKVVFLNRYPGLFFWSGLLGGFLALWWFSKKLKIAYLQAGDFAIIGLLIGSFFTQIGCFLGGCGAGVATNLFFGISQSGLIGARIPIQLAEALVLLIAFSIFWKLVLKFYVHGTIFAKGLILLSVIKILASFFKDKPQTLSLGILINLDLLFSLMFLIYGLFLHYKVNKITPITDLVLFSKLFTDPRSQKLLVTNIKRGWYNQKVNFWVRLGRGKKKLFRLLNIRSNPESF